MAHGFSNRVWADTATTGTGNVTVGSAKPAHCTPGQAGTQDGDERTWLLEEGNDFEIFRGAYTASGSVVTRGTVLLSLIAGSVSTSVRMDLQGSATIREVAAGEDLISKVNAGAFGLSFLAAALVADAWTLLDASAPASAAFRRGNILGTVSQSGGVPTGAILERGNNANGYYFRFANGLQVCTHFANVNSATGGALGWTFPAPFAASPHVAMNMEIGAGSDAKNFNAQMTYQGISGSGATLTYTTASTVTGHLIAIGRWF